MPESLTHALRELGNPQYLHLVLHPLLVQGLALCGLFVLGSTLLRQPRAAALGLLLLAGCALAVVPYLHAREAALAAVQAAHSKYAATEIAGLGDRLHQWAWVHEALAGLAVLALVAIPAKATGRVLGIATAVLALADGLWGLDFHHRESRIYHPNLAEAPGVVSPALPVAAPAVRTAVRAKPSATAVPRPPVESAVPPTPAPP